MAPKYNQGVCSLRALAPTALSLGSFLTVLHDSTRAECDEWYADKNRGERLSLKGRALLEERRGGGMEGNMLGGGSGEAVKCLWSRQWEIHRKSDVGGCAMETKSWMPPHRH